MATVAGLHAFLCGLLLAWTPDPPSRAEVKRLASFELQPPPPPPPPPPEPRPASRSSAPKQAAGASGRRADLAPAIAPRPLVPAVTRRLAAADRTSARRGSATTTGASDAGSGSGAGGVGDGSGGGGSGGDGFGDGAGGGLGSEARLLYGNLDRSDYRRIRAFGSPRGSAVLAIEVGPGGTLTGCQPVTGSGNSALDAELCTLLSRTRWEPARDRSGRAVTVALRYVANWDRN